jgi:transposase
MERCRLPNRPMEEAILWKHLTGELRRDLPDAFGPWSSIYTRSDTWRKRGIWQGILACLQKDADVVWLSL